MAYSVNQLIANAFYLSRVRSKDFQNIGADDISVGLDLFNKVLAQTAINTKMIPYYQEYDLTAVVGQETYFIPNLVEPFSLTFNMTTVRYATSSLSRREYHSTTRIDGINALPFNVTFEKTYNLPIIAATKVSGGSGYVVGDVLKINGGNQNATLTVATLSGTAVATVTVTTAGSGYKSGVTYGVTGGSGTGATFTVTLGTGTGGCNMYVQFLPADTYPFKIWGKFALSSVDVSQLTQDLMGVYDMWYIDYLEHWTAKRICNYYSVPINPEVQAMIDQISANVNDMNTIDLTSRKLNLYSDKMGLGWAQVNLGHGFEPSGVF